jgi:hypothetical protein
MVRILIDDFILRVALFNAVTLDKTSSYFSSNSHDSNKPAQSQRRKGKNSMKKKKEDDENKIRTKRQPKE